MKRGVIGIVAICVSLAPAFGSSLSVATADVPPISVVTPVPASFTPYAGLRLRAIGSLNVTSDEYLGVASLGVSTNRIEANFTVPRFVTNGNNGAANGDCAGNYAIGSLARPSANAWRFTWDPVADTLRARLSNASMDCTLVFRDLTQEVANANGWTLARARAALVDVNSLQLSVDDRQAGAHLNLRDVMVDDTEALGSFGNPGSASSWLATGPALTGSDGFAVSGSLDLGGAFATCTDLCSIDLMLGYYRPPNEPPVVRRAAEDTAGHEGGALAAAGAFVDPDGDPLAISGEGRGTLTDHGDGSWSWTLSPTDDGSGVVKVTASDGKGGSVTDAFEWAADNLPPNIVSLTPGTSTVLAGADVTWTALATDPGSGDTHVWSFDGGLGSASGLNPTFTRHYPGCGTYTLDATVTDDDGGSDTQTSNAAVTVGEAAVLPPLASGRTLVQPGRVVPVKVRVGCADGPWLDLAPSIELLDGSGSIPAGSVSNADTAGVMRAVDGMYLYNLRIPSDRAVARGGELTVHILPFGPAGGAIDIPLQLRT
jgi:hypothetical protein